MHIRGGRGAYVGHKHFLPGVGYKVGVLDDGSVKEPHLQEGGDAGDEGRGNAHLTGPAVRHDHTLCLLTGPNQNLTTSIIYT